MININQLLDHYNLLKNSRLEIVAGKKGENELIEVLFDDTHFKHLAGIHKLTDTVFATGKFSSEKFCDEVRRGNITQADLEKSAFFSKGSFNEEDPPKVRFELLYNLMNMIDQHVVEPHKISKGSCRSIKAHFQLQIMCELNVRFFLQREKGTLYYAPVTLIRNNDIRYNCEKRTLVYLSIYDFKSQKRKEVHRLKNFIPQFDESDRIKI
ncbi:PBECR4 domain-containing protein [Proteiniclasticum sp. QWL-01]|uniref:PBECR4 domain-containing protein n=1 Tax=Proteiniclasticum sp. QWL-01 TaxID=3036945 RepID=UPI0024110553|nr:PBECR4 domain-containing protein [Proteiniclasticum sp. QWL-01]WFF74035.1 PBECR4 domain-containing protein [Proteiniclasticum sp. QWL-01]